MNFEKHLCILWGSELNQLKELKRHILASGYKITSESMYQIKAQRDMYLFIRSFYYNSNTDFLKKVERVNPAKFCALEVDLPKKYGYVSTSRGCSIVNINSFQLKQSFRKVLKSCSDGLHVSDTSDEYLVQSLQLECFFAKKNNKFLISTYYEFTGFRCLDDLKRLLNASIKYVVMRSPQDFNEKSKAFDIDIMVESRDKFVRLIQGERLFEDKARVLFKCALDGSQSIFDVREPLDDYYPSPWAYEMLAKREYSEKHHVYVNSLINRYYSLAYHCFLHKDAVAEKHQVSLDSMHKKMFNVLMDDSLEDSLKIHFIELHRFMSGHSIVPSPCADTTVGLNWKNLKSLARGLTFDSESSVYKSRISALQNKYIKYLLSDFSDSVLLHTKNGAHHRSIIHRVQGDFVVKKTFFNSTQGLVTSFDEARVMGYLPEMYRPKLYWSGLRVCDESNEVFAILLMEYIDGILLSKVLKDLSSKRLAENREIIASSLLKQVDQVQSLFRSLRFQHRDLRPENIMITPDLRIKIIDFGLSISDWEPDKDVQSLSYTDCTGNTYDLRDDNKAFDSIRASLSLFV